MTAPTVPGSVFLSAADVDLITRALQDAHHVHSGDVWACHACALITRLGGPR